MSFPSTRPASRTSIASGDSKSSLTSSGRPRTQAWALPGQSSSRRTPLPLSTSTNLNSDVNSRASGANSSTTPNPSSSTSAFAFPFPTAAVTGSRGSSHRHNPSSTSSSTPQPPGQQFPGPSLLSSRSRTNTSSVTSSTQPASTAPTITTSGRDTPTTAQQLRAGPLSPTTNLSSPTSTVFERNPFSTQTGSSTSAAPGSGVSKIIITQIFLLLSTITEKEGRGKWESQAASIRKLVEQNGMEVFSKYFQRLLNGNAPQIFSITNRSVENSANYPLLKEEVVRASRDFEHAWKIIDVIENSDGDLYREFDLVTFVQHFKLDALGNCVLASAAACATRPELRSKAISIIASDFLPALHDLASQRDLEPPLTITCLANATIRLPLALPAQHPERSDRTRFYQALDIYFKARSIAVPAAINSAVMVNSILDEGVELGARLLTTDISSVSTTEGMKSFLQKFIDGDNAVQGQLGATLLLLALCPEPVSSLLPKFAEALRQFPKVVWANILDDLDRVNIQITPTQFLNLYKAVQILNAQSDALDIQGLWGGKWQNPSTQLSFVVSFLAQSREDIDVSTIPNLVKVYDPTEWTDQPEKYAELTKAALQDTTIVYDAILPLSELFFGHTTEFHPSEIEVTRRVVLDKWNFMICSLAALPKPWPDELAHFLNQGVSTCITKQKADYDFVLYTLWRLDRHWMATRLIDAHSLDPLNLPTLLEHAENFGWLDDLCTMLNGFGIDLAALAHRNDLLDIDKWIEDKLQRGAPELCNALSRFLQIKAQDELRTNRREQVRPRTVSLAMKTVHAMLQALEQHSTDRVELVTRARDCLQAFPRLINYGQGYDAVIEANGANGNMLSRSADTEMQDLYKRMYSGELQVREIIETLQACKTSQDPGKQDLFACMIHGLYDEYVCFKEYPLGPLATTAVLFGGIISYKLVTGLALEVGLEMVLEAVRDSPPDAPMYKFGLQALLHFLDRLYEFHDFTTALVQIPGLKGTEVHSRGQEVLREYANNGGRVNGSAAAGERRDGEGTHEINQESLVQQFSSITPDPPADPDVYEDPDEKTQDTVLFVLNNLSEQNLTEKLPTISNALTEKHYQWFASHIVEQRAKLQPNYQTLYLDLLQHMNSKRLWADVLRETYVSVRKQLNLPATMKQQTELSQLNNLGVWLGSLTLARDKPIKFKNITFKELLLEGFETKRMKISIRFTCQVLVQGVRSTIFKPPNPWLMEIISLLLELSDLPEIGMNDKFAIQALLRDFGLKRTGDDLPRSNELMRRKVNGDIVPAGSRLHIDDADNLSHLSKDANGALRSGSPDRIIVPNLSGTLSYPPFSHPLIPASQLNQLLDRAVETAIGETTAGAMDRSIAVATVTTSKLVQKDFAQEIDMEKLRSAAEKMASQIAGSLVIVAVKDNIRLLVNSYIRSGLGDNADQPVIENWIVTAVNENIDGACNLIQDRIVRQAIVEIQPFLSEEAEKRRIHRQNNPDKPYRDAIVSSWSTFLPEPWQTTSEGLNAQQMEIYSSFAPQLRATPNHTTQPSLDNGRQAIGGQQDNVFSMLGVETGQNDLGLLQRGNGQYMGGLGHSLPGGFPPGSRGQDPGAMDFGSVQDTPGSLLNELRRFAANDPDKPFHEIEKNSPVYRCMDRIVEITAAMPEADYHATQTAQQLALVIYRDNTNRLETEIFAQLIRKFCDMSPPTELQVGLPLRTPDDDKVINLENITVTAALLQAKLIDFYYVDAVIARALTGRNEICVQAFSDLLDDMLFTEEPSAYRSSFAASFNALREWIDQGLDLPVARSILDKLAQSSSMTGGVTNVASLLSEESNEVSQLQYMMNEWMALLANPEDSPTLCFAFVKQLHGTKLLTDKANILRLVKHEMELTSSMLGVRGDIGPAYARIDGLARLLVLLANSQKSVENKTHSNALETILTSIALVLNKEHVTKGEHFSQKAFYRLFSSMLCEWQSIFKNLIGNDSATLAFARTFLSLQPSRFPGFTFAWVSLLCHREFIPAMIQSQSKTAAAKYAQLLSTALSYEAQLSDVTALTAISQEYSRGLLKLLLLLHHDVPEFLAEHHFELVNATPSQHMQMRNLILSAMPPSARSLSLADGSSAGQDIIPELAVDPQIMLGELRPAVNDLLESSSVSVKSVNSLISKINDIKADQAAILHALVLRVVQTGAAKTPFSSANTCFEILTRVFSGVKPETQNLLLTSLIDQLRYANAHTLFSSALILSLFPTNEDKDDLGERIASALLERVVVHRPYPMGVIRTLRELVSGSEYRFWETAFAREHAADLRELVGNVLPAQQGQAQGQTQALR